MTNSKMTREEMQTEAMATESLIGTAVALLTAGDTEATFTMLELAQEKVQGLNLALDLVNAQEAAA